MTGMKTREQTERCKGCGTPVTREIPTDGSALAAVLSMAGAWCDDCDRKAQAEMDERDLADRQYQVQRERDLRVKASGLPAIHQTKRIRDLAQPDETLAAAEAWVADGGGLLLTGDVGRGKTTLAGAAAWERLQRKSIIWTSAPLLFARLGTGLGSEQRAWALDLLANTKALVLDDIDKARPTEYGAEQVFLAVDQRVEHQAPLLVTSNLSPSRLAEHWPDPYGVAIASRLVGYCKVVRIEGVDRRLQPLTAIEGGKS